MEQITESELYFISCSLWRISILDGYNAVIVCGLYDVIKNNDVVSFMFNDDPRFGRLAEVADRRCGHSGASYGITMRTVERMIKMGLSDWKIWYIQHNRPDMLHKAKIITKQVRKSLSDPSYAMCRRRLQHEFFELII